MINFRTAFIGTIVVGLFGALLGMVTHIGAAGGAALGASGNIMLVLMLNGLKKEPKN